MADTGRPPHAREAVRTAIREAGAAGILGSEIGVKHYKAQVHRLRMAGMPIVSRRERGSNCRYWASPELAGFAQPRTLKQPERDTEFVGPPRPTLRLRILESLAPRRMGLVHEELLKLGNKFNLNNVLVRMRDCGEVHRCKVNGNGNRTIYFSTAERMRAYQALAVAPEPPVRVATKRDVYRPPVPAAPAARPNHHSEVITPEGLVPTACRGYVPPDLAAGAVPFFRLLEIGSYIPSDSAIARAYGASRASSQTA